MLLRERDSNSPGHCVASLVESRSARVLLLPHHRPVMDAMRRTFSYTKARTRAGRREIPPDFEGRRNVDQMSRSRCRAMPQSVRPDRGQWWVRVSSGGRSASGDGIVHDARLASAADG